MEKGFHDQPQTPQDEALAFVNKHREFFEHYARGSVKFEPAPEGLDTFAFNLETNTIYISPRFYQELGFSEEKTAFATLHETEHFKEKVAMLNEPGGERVFERYLKRIKDSKAYGVMDNCIADVRENEAVVSKTHEGFRDIEQACYREDLFKETDFTKEPRHLQLSYALLREARVPDEACTVSPEVREKIDQIRAIKGEDGSDFFKVLTDPNVPMSTRLKLQDQYIWPIVKELLDKDIEDQKKNQKEGDDKGKGDGKGQGNKNGDNKPEEGDKKDKSGKSSEGKGEKGKKGKPAEKTGEGKEDPNETFKEAYARADKKVPNAVPQEGIEKAFKEWKESKGENPLDKADKEYAAKLGVKKEDLQEYRRITESLEKIINPETGQSVIQDLKDLIQRIIAKRMKPVPAPRYPVDEGEDLVDPATLVAEAKAGNFEPKVWETHETKEKPGKQFGEVEITLVCDRSGSMSEGSKLVEQRKSAVLIMEALKELEEMCEEEAVNLTKPLEIRSEIYSFQETSADSVPIKKMSKELSEKERISVVSILSSTQGGTTDFVPLESISKNLSEPIKEKIKSGEVKKIAIVFTDGGSNDPQRVKNVLESLRKEGVVVVGVGITEGGRPALTTYAPEAKLAETAEKLPIILGDLLKEHFKDI